MALIRYQVLPARYLPPHQTRQLPPLTLVTTVILAPVLIVTRRRADVYGRVRRFALQRATLVVVAPSTSFGSETAVLANANNPESSAIRTMRGRCRRRRCSAVKAKTCSFLLDDPGWPTRNLRTITPWSQS